MHNSETREEGKISGEKHNKHNLLLLYALSLSLSTSDPETLRQFSCPSISSVVFCTLTLTFAFHYSDLPRQDAQLISQVQFRHQIFYESREKWKGKTSWKPFSFFSRSVIIGFSNVLTGSWSVMLPRSLPDSSRREPRYETDHLLFPWNKLSSFGTEPSKRQPILKMAW